jgi:hypothetical protein
MWVTVRPTLCPTGIGVNTRMELFLKWLTIPNGGITVRSMTPRQAALKLAAIGWSDARIGRMIGCSQPTVFRIRSGLREPRYELAVALIALAKKEARRPRKPRD